FKNIDMNMSNKLKIISCGFSVILLLTFLPSCKDILEEDLTTAHGMDYYKTDAGIKDLVVGAYYQVFCAAFKGESVFCNTNYGTDEFHVGGDASNAMWNNYDGRLGPIVSVVNSNTVAADAQWNNLYTGISDAN